MAQDAWRAYLELAIGATDATRKKATKTVKQLVGKGALSGEQLQTMVEDLLRTSAASREAMTNLVRYELDKALGRIGLASADEVASLTAQVRELEAKLQEATAVPPGAIEPVDGPPVGAEVVDRLPVTTRTVAKKTVKAAPAKAPVKAPVKAAAKAPAKAAVKAPAKKIAKKAVKKAIVEPVLVEAPGAAPAGAEPLAPPAARKAVKRVAAARKSTAATKTAPRRPAGGVA